MAPDDAFLHSDTPWDDLYRSYGWPQVQTMLSVQSATITGVSSAPEMIATKSYQNDLSDSITCHADLTQTITNTIESNWSSTDQLSVSQSVSYEVAGIGGETGVQYSHTWGQGGSSSNQVTIGSTSGIDFLLAANSKATAELVATKGIVTIRVVYHAYLTGCVAINYKGGYQGHHFYAVPIDAAMAAYKIPNMKTITVDITVDLYSNTKIVVHNDTGMSLVSHPTASMHA